MTDAVLDHALGQRDAFLARLSALVAQPSVGADPAYADGMESARRLLETRLADAGFQGLRRLTALDGSGQPAIYAEWLRGRRRPDPDRLRPLRRAAPRSARPLAVAPLRGDGA